MLFEREPAHDPRDVAAGDVTPPTDDSTLSDEVIVRRVLAGDRDLFRELVRRHKAVVFGSIMRQVGSRAVAEELAQETFVRAFTGLHSFRFEARFSTWVVRIALNATSSYFSSRAYRELKRTTAFEPASHDSRSAPDGEELRERKQRIDRFRSELERLAPRLREVLVLCGVEGRPYEEVAAVLGIPVGTVRSRLNKARLEMRRALAEPGGEGAS